MAARRSDGDDSGFENERIVDREVLPVHVHAAPRYERFLLFGLLGGLTLAIVMTGVAGMTEEPGGPMSTGLSGLLVVFAVYAAIFVGAGLLIASVLSMTLARIWAGRAQRHSAEHDTALNRDPFLPGNDDIPRWVHEAEDLARVKKPGRIWRPPNRDQPDATPR
jgi:hypothetical protein|nr:hypothetical protein [Microbacterium lemovicicum]